MFGEAFLGSELQSVRSVVDSLLQGRKSMHKAGLEQGCARLCACVCMGVRACVCVCMGVRACVHVHGCARLRACVCMGACASVYFRFLLGGLVV